MSTTTTVLVSTFSPFSTLCLSVPSDSSFNALYDAIATKYPSIPPNLLLSHPTLVPNPSTPLSSLTNDSNHPVSLRLSPRLVGGKGGFGSQLRAAGGRMSSQKTSNNDSCRDLTGRRLSTIKEAKKLAEYIESEPARRKAEQEAKKAKLEALEKKLGISKDPDASTSDGKKRRLEDTEYVEQSQEIVENVKSAVASALLKKRKKAKLNNGSAKPTKDVPSTTVPEVVQKVVESPATAPVATVAAIAISSVGA